MCPTKHLLCRNLYPVGDNPHKVVENRWIDETNVYETKKLVEEYLQLHYGADDEVLPYPFSGLGDLALNFPSRCVSFPSGLNGSQRLTSSPIQMCEGVKRGV